MERRRYENPVFTAFLFVILFLGIIAAALDPTGLLRGQGGTVSYDSLSGTDQLMFLIGLFMIALGFIIRFVAIATLKRNFSGLLRIREGHTLTKNGIYHWIRHPAYLGAIILFLGIPVMLSSVVGFLVMFLLVPYLLYRISLEEKMLTERFGAEYEEYARQSKKLIPFIY